MILVLNQCRFNALCFHRATQDTGYHELTLHSWSNPAEFCGFNMAKYANKIHTEPIKGGKKCVLYSDFQGQSISCLWFHFFSFCFLSSCLFLTQDTTTKINLLDSLLSLHHPFFPVLLTWPAKLNFRYMLSDLRFGIILPPLSRFVHYYLPHSQLLCCWDGLGVCFCSLLLSGFTQLQLPLYRRYFCGMAIVMLPESPVIYELCKSQPISTFMYLHTCSVRISVAHVSK